MVSGLKPQDPLKRLWELWDEKNHGIITYLREIFKIN